MTVYIENECNASFDFEMKAQLELLTQAVLDYAGCPYEAEVSVTIVDRDEIQQINYEFRQIDHCTDVLSFPMMEYDAPADFEGDAFQGSITTSPETGELILGDIVLCAPVIYEQAKEYGHTPLREFSFLVVHSLLHLLGYDHMEEEERMEMEQVQREIMNKLQINR